MCNSHLAESKFEISPTWLTASHSRWCPCGVYITSLALLCSTCRGAASEIVRRQPPVADGLPPPPGPKPDISVSLRGPELQAIGNHDLKDWEGGATPSVCYEKLLELCQVDVPLLKFLPEKPLPFSAAWARLFIEACTTRSLASWKSCFMFPKAVMLAPVRAGRRVVQKKGSLATQVLEKIQRFTSDRESLWKEVLDRATSRKPRDRDEKSDGSVLEVKSADAESMVPARPLVPEKAKEKAAVAALRIITKRYAFSIPHPSPQRIRRPSINS